ncbi:hypothetical protein DFH27DRAFT_643889 [Peziza echinospora]|nr:hypothetical protein DFH27DRAFT_643889 [Peziza echinospora]
MDPAPITSSGDTSTSTLSTPPAKTATSAATPPSSSSGGTGSSTNTDLPLLAPAAAIPDPPLPKWALRVLPAWRFLRGPTPPRPTLIRPLLPRLQAVPARTLKRLLPRRRHRWAAQLAFWAVWLVGFAALVHRSRFETRVGGADVLHLDCTAAYWARNSLCGLNGALCRPFEAGELVAFRCPSGCLTTKLLNPRAVGNASTVFTPFVVGGEPLRAGPADASGGGVYGVPYRADSFICQAAIHAGIVTDRFGGCGLLKQTGASPALGYAGTHRNGLRSLGFPASFPSSYVFVRPGPGVAISGCTDLRWHILPFSALFTAAQGLIASTALAFSFPALVAAFWHVGLVSDPPLSASVSGGGYELVSLVLSRFIPVIFVFYVIYLHVLGPTWATNTRLPSPPPLLGSPTGHPSSSSSTSSIPKPGGKPPKPPFPLPASLTLERTLLFLLGLWITSLTNITLDPLIPLARLTSHDISTQPGAKAALAIIIIILAIIVLTQAHFLRIEGRLPRFLALYGGVALVLITLAFAWSSTGALNLRIHHYIIGLLLLPGTKIGNRQSMLYQGLLLGLLVNGVARWGFASLLETGAGLRGDAVLGVGGVPRVLSPLSLGLNGTGLGGGGGGNGGNVTFRWQWPTPDENRLFDGSTGEAIPGRREFDGISILVNDVERARIAIPSISSTVTTQEDGDGSLPVEGQYTYPRRRVSAEGEFVEEAAGGVEWETLFVRMAFTSSERGVGDYSRAGTVLGFWPGRGVEGGSGGGGGQDEEGGIESGWIPPPKGRT